jgi:uncharacterized protein YjeT (DUF2065 family)
MAWNDLLAAFALYLVLEGLMPFANPRGTKRTMLQLSQLDERALRWVGLASMTGGLVLLYFVRQHG